MLLQSLVELLLQDHCVGCAAMQPPGRAVCPACELTMERLSGMPVCPRCADLAGAQRCFRCQESPPPFERVHAGAVWGGAVKDAVRRLKFEDAPWIAAPLIRWAFPDVEPLRHLDVLIPMPLHARRHRERGYNQARLLAQALAESTKQPVRTDVLTRARATAAVANLAPDARAQAVKDAFSVMRPDAVRGRRVGLVDDVVTTSSTAREAARVLKEAGALSVDVIAVARGGDGGEPD